ncbi:hypothetical protein [Nocardioides luteus]|uniref:hypothetical protein n=1 Tax=Nocardioides luteus TaxID=1844 RepID=UPI0018CBBD44|nr:hypothetical protein [Nocardioides luteus]MBG6094448.1 hypothetical protein [Nocardioides luteus]
MGLERLESAMVLTTVETLRGRIAARFPDRGLVKVAEELAGLIRESSGVGDRLRRRLGWTRVVSRTLIVAVLALTLVAIVWALATAFADETLTGVQWLPLMESTVNDLIFAAVAIFFLYTIPERLLRSRALKLLHRLRSLAHIIDMHQLTKDPERLRTGFKETSASVKLTLDADELIHYLEYCSELLSLVGKTAALCAEDSQDNVVLDTVSTVEGLTVDLSRKIWQKIQVVGELREEQSSTSA